MAREEVPVSLRRAIVEADVAGLNVTAFCRDHQISTWFFWDLRRRHRAEGGTVLEPKSRAPSRVANKTPAAVEDAIVAERKRLTEAGLDAGAETIAFHLAALEGLPSPSTIWRILRARGFVEAQPAKAPKRTMRSFTAERANDCWQLDDTTWELADTSAVKILNVVDDHSRLLVASAAAPACTGAFALVTVAGAAAVVGWPARFLSDNATAFRFSLAEALGAIGVGHGHSRPHHPQTNGKVERFHQTLKRWLARQPRTATIAELQAQLDCFRHLYNHQRPHRSIGRRFPAEVWAAAPKSGPPAHPLGAPTSVHHATVLGSMVRLSRYRITVGAVYDGQPATVIVTGTACHVFVDGHLVRQLTLDPTRKDQTLYTRRGHPGRLR
jgi:transposase InsO family protein